MKFFQTFLHKLKNHFVPSEENVYRPHALRKPWLIFFVAAILTAEGIFLVDLVARQSALDFIAAVLPGEVIALTNDERSLQALHPVTEAALLTAAAQAKAADMAEKGYFAHVGPDGKEPWEWVSDAGYQYQYAGENLAVRFTGSSDVVNAWMASPSHRANIVKPAYQDIGVGVAQGMFQGQPATFVVQYFGTPRANTVVALANIDVPAAVATAPTPADMETTPQVEGAATENPAEVIVGAASNPTLIPVTKHQETPLNSVIKGLLQNETNPSMSVLWVLVAVATLMVVGLALTFFVHIQIQPTDMLISGSVVALLALAFIALNTHTPFAAGPTQTAAVIGALPSEGGFIDAKAAVVESL